MKAAVFLLALAIALPASADTLLIERTQVAQGMKMPTRGQSMAQVEAGFGAPQTKNAAVGGGSAPHPPITRWTYPTFSVYFERDRVISSVLTHANPNELGPKPAK